MYKDRDKQRKAGRERARRYRNVHKSNAQKVTPLQTDALKPTPLGNVGNGALNQDDGASQDFPPKRGLDIKVFSDLPPDVQDTINRMSTNDGKVDEAEKDKRTVAAIKYQHLFPDSYEAPSDQDFTRLICTVGKGVLRPVSKPGDADYVPMCETTRRYSEGRGAGSEST